jgi:hypothetical protein
MEKDSAPVAADGEKSAENLPINWQIFGDGGAATHQVQSKKEERVGKGSRVQRDAVLAQSVSVGERTDTEKISCVVSRGLILF